MTAHHLQYESVDDWMVGENVPAGFVSLDDADLRDRYITEYGELRRHLFAKHALTLNSDDQRKLKEGIHPSQSHSFAADAEPYCQLLAVYLRSLGIEPHEIVLGWYHMDRIVLTIYLAQNPKTPCGLNYLHVIGSVSSVFLGSYVLSCNYFLCRTKPTQLTSQSPLTLTECNRITSKTS